MKITAVILTRNEEKNIKECIDSLKFCDEILVVDDESSDKTKELAEKNGARVIFRKMNKDFSSQLNFAGKKAKNGWIFVVDADERVSENLRKEIEGLKEESGVNGYFIKRRDFFLGKEIRYGDVWKFKSLRLYRKGAGEWKRRVHPDLKLLGRNKKLKGYINHYPHGSIKEFIFSINRWSEWHAMANFEEGKRSSVFKIAIFPFLKLVKNFVFRLGFLDGTGGFVHSLMMSFHSYLSWSKLWFYQKKKNL